MSSLVSFDKIYKVHKRSIKVVADSSNIYTRPQLFKKIDITNIQDITVSAKIYIPIFTTGDFVGKLYFCDSSFIKTGVYTLFTISESNSNFVLYTKIVDLTKVALTNSKYMGLYFGWYNSNNNPNGTAYIDTVKLEIGSHGSIWNPPLITEDDLLIFQQYAVDTPSVPYDEHIKVFVYTNGSSPTKETSWKVKMSNGDEIILASVIT